MDWKTLLAYITGTVDQELLLHNEYLVTENRILRNQITGRIRLRDGERKTLAEIGQKLGKQALEAVATIVKPDTILGWHRTLVAQKFNGSQQHKAPGRPTIDQELEALVVRVVFQKWRWSEIAVTLGLVFAASMRKESPMTFIAVRCPYCQSDQIVKRGKTARGTQRYFCQNTLCAKGSFLLDYGNRGCLPEVKQTIIDMRLNASGVRDTARSLHICPNTVLRELKKKETALESVNTSLLRTLNPAEVAWDMERAGESPGKQNTQKIERKHLTLRTRMKRLVRKTICFSKTIQMHDIVIGLFVNRYAFGQAV